MNAIGEWKCHSCGKNCLECEEHYCIMCEFGYWLDESGTVCVQWCASGSRYDDVTESNRCVKLDDDSTVLAVWDFSMTEAESYIHRRYTSSIDQDINGNRLQDTFELYGGSN
jgi:hypothetical protein